MRTRFGLVAAGLSLVFAASASSMPANPLSAEPPDLHKIADGCGKGWRLNSSGDCVPIRKPRRVYRQPRPSMEPPPYYWGWGSRPWY